LGHSCDHCGQRPCQLGGVVFQPLQVSLSIHK
jgi:hypothetical protein